MLVRLLSGPLTTQRLPSGRRRLLADLVVDVRGRRITVPAGTITDFSSIPWYGRMLVRWSRVDIAGTVHDWLYREGTLSRAEADHYWYLLAVAGEHHANVLQGFIGWCALRIGGGAAWRRCRKSSRKSSSCPVCRHEFEGRREHRDSYAA